MFRVDAPARMSTPGHPISGADGVGDAGWVTPGLALENMPEMRLPNELSAVTLDAEEQPDSITPPSNSAAASQPPHARSSWRPRPIEITRLFWTLPAPS